MLRLNPKTAVWVSIALLASALLSSMLTAGETNDRLAERCFVLDDDGVAMLPVEIFDETVKLIVDTGSRSLLIDQRFKKRLGVPVNVVTAGTSSKNIRVERYEGPEFRIPGSDTPLSFKCKFASCTDLSQVSEAINCENVGIVGMEFLINKIIRFDFDERCLRFPQKPTIGSGHVEQLRFIMGLPHLIAGLPNEGFQSFMVDTGATNSIMLESGLFNRLKKKQKLVVTDLSRDLSVSGAVSRRNGVLESFEFGEHRFYNVQVSEGGQNIIGLRFLKRFEVEFDFPNGVARFRPGKMIDANEPPNPSGFKFRSVRGEKFASIDDDLCEASKAGIQTDDRILKINGIDADKLSQKQIFDIRARSGSELRLLLSRDGAKHEVVLTIPEYNDPFPGKPVHEVIVPAKAFDE